MISTDGVLAAEPAEVPMAAREIDRLVASVVLGWKRQPARTPAASPVRRGRGEPVVQLWHDAHGAVYIDVPHYTDTLHSAGQVLRALADEGYLWTLRSSVGGWEATVALPGGGWEVSARTLSQAICLVALAAKGVDVAGVVVVEAAA